MCHCLPLLAMQRFLHFRHRHPRRPSDKSDFQRLASRDLPDGVCTDEMETLSAPPTATADKYVQSTPRKHGATSPQHTAMSAPPVKAPNTPPQSTPPPPLRSAKTLRVAPKNEAVQRCTALLHAIQNMSSCNLSWRVTLFVAAFKHVSTWQHPFCSDGAMIHHLQGTNSAGPMQYHSSPQQCHIRPWHLCQSAAH